MRSPRRLGDKAVRAFHVRYFKGGESAVKLAEEAHATPNGLRKAFQRLGLPLRTAGPGTRRKMTDKERKAICRDRLAGYTVDLLSEKYKRDQTVIYRALKQGQVDLPVRRKVRDPQTAARAKMALAQQALEASLSDAQKREPERDVVVHAITEFIRRLEGLEIQEVRIRIPARTYEVSYMHTEEGQC